MKFRYSNVWILNPNDKETINSLLQCIYILCISPFLLARQFIQIYFKRIVDERKPKLRRWRIEYPFAFHYKTMRTNRSFSSLSLTSAGNTLQIAFFFVIIPFLESSITRIVSVKLVKHFSNRGGGRHTHEYTDALLLFLVSCPKRKSEETLTYFSEWYKRWNIYRIEEGYRRTGSRIKRRGLAGRWTRVQKFRFPRTPAGYPSRRSRCFV